MGISVEQSDALLCEAERLSASDGCERTPLLNIADRLGLVVWLNGHPVRSEGPSGRLDYTSPPRVTINRVAQSPFAKRLTIDDEELLRPRDRFTLAHEIGHWLAYCRFDVGPATNRSEYWQDEAAVNQFAGRLLVPDSLVDAWLGTLSCQQGVHVQQMTTWARQAVVSREVASLRLCQRRKGIGFLALQARSSRQQYFPDLLVSHSATDPSLNLPGRRRVLRSERLSTLLSAATTDADRLPHFSFDRHRRQVKTYYVSWVHVGDRAGYSPGPVYWTAWSNTGFARGSEVDSARLLL